MQTHQKNLTSTQYIKLKNDSIEMMQTNLANKESPCGTAIAAIMFEIDITFAKPPENNKQQSTVAQCCPCIYFHCVE